MVLEVLKRSKLIRFNIVEQCPQFFSVVLDRSASQEQNSIAGHFLKGSEYFGIGVLESMCFINDNVLKGNVNEDTLDILEEYFITGDKDMEFVDSVGVDDCPLGADVSVEPLIGSAGGPAFTSIHIIVEHSIQVGPLVHCPLPVLQGRQGGDHQERSFGRFKGVQVVQECSRLNSFA